jgi:hypothetical protein
MDSHTFQVSPKSLSRALMKQSLEIAEQEIENLPDDDDDDSLIDTLIF